MALMLIWSRQCTHSWIHVLKLQENLWAVRSRWQKKFFTLISRKDCPPSLCSGVSYVILTRIVWPCRMLLLRWHCCNLCRQVEWKQFRQRYIAITDTGKTGAVADLNTALDKNKVRYTISLLQFLTNTALVSGNRGRNYSPGNFENYAFPEEWWLALIHTLWMQEDWEWLPSVLVELMPATWWQVYHGNWNFETDRRKLTGKLKRLGFCKRCDSEKQPNTYGKRRDR